MLTYDNCSLLQCIGCKINMHYMLRLNNIIMMNINYVSKFMWIINIAAAKGDLEYIKWIYINYYKLCRRRHGKSPMWYGLCTIVQTAKEYKHFNIIKYVTNI